MIVGLFLVRIWFLLGKIYFPTVTYDSWKEKYILVLSKIDQLVRKDFLVLKLVLLCKIDSKIDYSYFSSRVEYICLCYGVIRTNLKYFEFEVVES